MNILEKGCWRWSCQLGRRWKMDGGLEGHKNGEQGVVEAGDQGRWVEIVRWRLEEEGGEEEKL